MYSKAQLAFKYLNYYLTAANGRGHGIHSPFVFDFITRILKDKEEYGDYDKVEGLRQELLKDKRVVSVQDFGAGSSSSKSNRRSVASIARNVVKPKKYGQLLYRVVKYFEPETIIELGTSLGITTGYLALAQPGAHILTFEGARQISNLATENFTQLGIHNIKQVDGHFDYTLPAVLYQLPTVDFAFIDGNHRREPTTHYFHQLFGKRNNNSIFVLDDIHWSSEMEQAWDMIRENPAITCSIDLFSLGIILFRREFKDKQHFTIRF